MEIPWQDLVFWERVLDAAGLLLCTLAAFALLARRRERRALAFVCGRESERPGDPEPGAHRFRHGEWSGDPVSRPLSYSTGPAGPERDLGRRDDFSEARRTGPDEDIRTNGDRYAKAAELATTGLSASAIAEVLDLPRGEVELALKFRGPAPSETRSAPESVSASVIPLRDSRSRNRAGTADGKDGLP